MFFFFETYPTKELANGYNILLQKSFARCTEPSVSKSTCTWPVLLFPIFEDNSISNKKNAPKVVFNVHRIIKLIKEQQNEIDEDTTMEFEENVLFSLLEAT